MRIPFEEAYWVEPGRLLAGAYPGAYEAGATERRLGALLDCGIRTLIDLLEVREESFDSTEPPAYARSLEGVSRLRGIRTRWLRFGVHDMSVPSVELMDSVQTAIDESLARDHPVYVHCWRGRGRTGTVVGVYLLRAGLADPGDFVRVIGSLRGGAAAEGRSPETDEQIEFVRSYARSLRAPPFGA